jgi:anti-anti-sigma factor
MFMSLACAPISRQWLRGQADGADPLWSQIHEHLWICGRTASSSGVTLVELRGAIDSDSTLALARTFDELIGSAAISLYVDVSALETVDSVGARTLAQTANTLEARGGRLRVLNAWSSLERLLEMNGLGRLLIGSSRTR